MAEEAKPEENHAIISKERMVIPNSHGENLVGVLHSTGSKKVVILCHGFRSTKEVNTLVELIAALTRQGISAFHFDFAGNGESDGAFQYGNYRREAEDLRAVILHLSQTHEISAILGHSKGGNVVLLYASKYRDVQTVINVSGRFYLEGGVESRLGKDFMERIKKDGFIDVKDKTGKVEYRVTEESLMDRLNTDMHAASLSIGKDCRLEEVEPIIVQIALMEMLKTPSSERGECPTAGSSRQNVRANVKSAPTTLRWMMDGTSQVVNNTGSSSVGASNQYQYSVLGSLDGGLAVGAS